MIWSKSAVVLLWVGDVGGFCERTLYSSLKEFLMWDYCKGRSRVNLGTYADPQRNHEANLEARSTCLYFPTRSGLASTIHRFSLPLSAHRSHCDPRKKDEEKKTKSRIICYPKLASVVCRVTGTGERPPELLNEPPSAILHTPLIVPS
ncbi:hypothetical protein C8Q75DRAFT_229092 [Abortiporus biennis]|nr:hypothetical protein C8Q75DRAFT_229092 [Abortiporus biennis]